MQATEGQKVETAKQSILLTLFDKLDDQDKETVIQLSESLVEKHRKTTKRKEDHKKMARKKCKD